MSTEIFMRGRGISPYVFPGMKFKPVYDKAERDAKIIEYIKLNSTRFFGISFDTATRRTRKHKYIYTRFMISNFLRVNKVSTFREIADLFNKSDHTTIINSVKSHSALYDTNDLYRDIYSSFNEHMSSLFDVVSSDTKVYPEKKSTIQHKIAL